MKLDQPEPIAPALTDPPQPAPGARDLAWLVQDAAARAKTLLDGQVPPAHDWLADAIRLLASPHSITRLPETAARTEHTENELRRLLIAYRHGGPAGTHAAAGPTPASPAELAAARDAVQRSAPLGNVQITGDCLTNTTSGIQLRQGPDGCWYPFTEWTTQWRPVPGHSADPAQAYWAARRARQARAARS